MTAANKIAAKDFDHSLDYIDNDDTWLVHSKAVDYHIVCTSDYDQAMKVLSEPKSSALPFYLPAHVLPKDRKLDIVLIDRLKSDFRDYCVSHDYTACEMSKAIGYAVIYSFFPEVDYEIRLLAMKYLLYAFMVDDRLETMVPLGLFETLAMPFLENLVKITKDPESQLVNLMALNVVKNLGIVGECVIVQNIWKDHLIAFQRLLGPKVFKLFCDTNIETYEHLKKEIKSWAKMLAIGIPANFEARVQAKHVASAAIIVVIPILSDDEVQYHGVDESFSRLAIMSSATCNDVISHFKEAKEVTGFANPFNLVEVYRQQGMDTREAMRQAVKKRNELFRGMELVAECNPPDQRQSLTKVIKVMTGITHYYFSNKVRYGWSLKEVTKAEAYLSA